MSDPDDDDETARTEAHELHAHMARRAKGVGLGFAAVGLIGLIFMIVGLATNNDPVAHVSALFVNALGAGISIYIIGRTWSRSWR